VFTLRCEPPTNSFAANTVIIPRSLFLDSRLKADFDAGDHEPLANATLYGEDLGYANVSEGVAGVIARPLSGWSTNNVLDRLLRNATEVLVHEYVDITSYALLANLPADVVRILPWTGVVNGATGAPPEGLEDWVVNSLVAIGEAFEKIGQLVYGGLVALGTFLVNLGQAIWNWGMGVAGTVSEAVGAVAQAAADLLSKLVEAIVYAVVTAVRALLDTVIQPIVQMIEDLKVGIVQAIRSLSVRTTADAFATALGSVLFSSQLFFAIMLVTVGVSVAEKITMVGSGGLGAVLMNILIPLVRDMLIAAIVGLVVVKVLNSALPSEDQIASLVPAEFEVAGKLGFGFSKFFEKLGLYYAAETRGFKSLPAVEKGFLYALVGFVMLLIGMALPSFFDPVTSQVGKVLIDGVAIYFAFFVAMPSLGKAKGPLTRAYPLMFPVGEALSLVATVSSIATLIADVATLGDMTGFW
jgi:hypothetical protein